MRYIRVFALEFTNMLHCIICCWCGWMLNDPLALICYDMMIWYGSPDVACTTPLALCKRKTGRGLHYAPGTMDYVCYVMYKRKTRCGLHYAPGMIGICRGLNGDKFILDMISCDVMHFMLSYVLNALLFCSLGSSSSPLSQIPQVCRYGLDREVKKSNEVLCM